MNHWILGCGFVGCMYDYCEAHECVEDAIESAADLYELTDEQIATLRENKIVALNESGTQYVEIAECDCGDLESHGEG